MFHSDNVLRSLSHLATRTVGIKGHASRVAGEAIKEALVAGTAFGASFANARYGSGGAYEIQGVPADLAGGLLISALSFADVLGKYDEFGHAVGSGLLAAYASRLGAKHGAEAKLAAGKTKTAGYFGVGAQPLYPTVDAHVQQGDWAQ